VLNAGKNKIKSIDEVRSLVSLRALILNGEDQRIEYQFFFFFLMVGGIVSFWVFADFADNEIVSICKLDQMKELNTLGEESLVPCFFAALGFRYVFM
jgi:protein phosphatase 1 regulatory subunit 7